MAIASPTIRLLSSTGKSMRASQRTGVSFQREMTPTAIANINNAINGTNIALKYGGPTESLAPVSASRIIGYSVPSKIMAAATDSSKLLINSNVSRDHTPNPTRLLTTGARSANNASEPPITTSRNTRINTPRVGSEAKACTEVNTPERTRKVPNRLSENATIAISTVQHLKTPRFSVAASE